MVTTIIIPDCDYKTFEKIADSLEKFIPFALYETSYRKNLNQGKFVFADAKFIPEPLLKYAKLVPGNADLVKELGKELEGI